MATFVTLFVAVQLFLGFCALFSLCRNAPEGFEDETGFHVVRYRLATRPLVLARVTPRPLSRLRTQERQWN